MREAIREKIESRFRVSSHSSGGGCDGSWDLGFEMKNRFETDLRSLELIGYEGGWVKVKIVENYRSRPKNDPIKELFFGVEKAEPDGALTENIVRAASYFVDHAPRLSGNAK